MHVDQRIATDSLYELIRRYQYIRIGPYIGIIGYALQKEKSCTKKAPQKKRQKDCVGKMEVVNFDDGK